MKHLHVLVANQLFETVCGSKIGQRIFEINPAFLPVNPPLMPVNPAFLPVNPPSVHRPSRTSRLAVAGAAQRAVRFRWWGREPLRQIWGEQSLQWIGFFGKILTGNHGFSHETNPLLIMSLFHILYGYNGLMGYLLFNGLVSGFHWNGFIGSWASPGMFFSWREGIGAAKCYDPLQMQSQQSRQLSSNHSTITIIVQS